MSLFEFVIAGPPVSQQARRRRRRDEWKEAVRAAAESYWPADAPPFVGPLAVTIYYFYEDAALDVDNLVKPFLDALIGLVYEDDRQISDLVCRRRDFRGPFVVRDVSPTLADGLVGGREFLYVRVEDAPSGDELVP